MNKPFAITLDVGSSLANLTGSWRTTKPNYLDRLPPCNNACPAGENIQAWLYYAEEGDYKKAWEEITKNNPLPAVHGRICYHPCEDACNRGHIDETVGIHAVERFLGDTALKQGWSFTIEAEPTGKHVMILGAGPSGLSAAYHLARLGHQVTIYDANKKAGGMMRYGIPRYRLPRGVLDGEIARIREMGVEFKMNTKVEDILGTMKENNYDAVYLAIGAQIGRMIDLPSSGGARILNAVEVLAQMETDDRPQLGDEVIVYGGGNTACDVARTATRLGAKRVSMVVMENQEQMPAHHFEIKEALEEGVELNCLLTIKKIDGKIVTLEKMRVAGERKFEGTGETITMMADSIVQAIGQTIDFSVVEKISDLKNSDGIVQIGPDMMTSHKGVFAGGDMANWDRSATNGVGNGKKAARNIDAYLRGTTYQAPEKPELADHSLLNPWYYGEASRAVQPMLDLVRRQSGFEEVLRDYTEDNAQLEARRCLSCGNCFECDNCYAVCPDNAVIKLGPGKRFEFNYDYCKGCGMCVSECPCGAIKMEPETI